MRVKTFKKDEIIIYLGDVMACFSKIADETVDLVFADPPYNLGKKFKGATDRFEPKQYLDWMSSWIKEIDRVLSPEGAVYLMNSTQNLAEMELICREKFFVQSTIAWVYDSSSVQARKRFGSSWEPILFMTKNKNKYTFNFEDILIEAKTGAKRGLIDYRKTPPQPYSATKVPTNVWQIPRVRYRMKEYENHPTQKPLALLERVILASTNKGDTVLDPFAGSFSSGYASNKLKRKFIGFEISEEYVKIGLRRLDFSKTPDNETEKTIGEKNKG